MPRSEDEDYMQNDLETFVATKFKSPKLLKESSVEVYEIITENLSESRDSDTERSSSY